MNAADFQTKVKEIQLDIQTKIQEAMMAGTPEAIPNLVVEMQARIEQLTLQMSAAPAVFPGTSAPPAVEKPIFGDHMTSLPLDRLAHPADKDFWRKLPGRESLTGPLKEIHESGIMNRSRRSMLASAMRLTPNVSKSLFEIVDHCKKTLDLKLPVELFVVQDQQFNAAMLPLSDGKLTIYLTSGLLESFTNPELAFVIGHEMGHALFGHNTIPLEFLIRNYGHIMSPKEVIGLRSWQRAGELSADRCGLLCAQDYTAACQAFFKLSSGITSSSFQFSVSDYMDQYADLEKYIKESPADQMEEFYSSHPLNPIRLKALELFSNCQFFHDLGKTGKTGTLDEAGMETQIRSFMSLMEPSYLEEESKIAASVREFIFLVGFMLAKSDGQIDPAELDQLSKILNSADAASRVQATLSLDDDAVIGQIVEHAEKINFEMPPVQRLNILRDVFSIACSDGKLMDEEIEEMAKICNVLQIRSTFVEELIRSVTQTDDTTAEAA